MRNLAIIPARSGSKGVRDKNIKELNGRPLIAHTIRAAIQSGKFDEVMVSTDSPIYADIARSYGAVVPFLRSRETSTDSAGSWDMVNEVLLRYKSMGKVFGSFCLLQPTSPLRTAEDIVGAYRLFEEKAAFAVVSVCEAEHSPLWCGRLPESREFIGFAQRENMVRRQAGGQFYRINGAIYIVKVEKFTSDVYLYQEGSYAYIMSQLKSIDIDSELDFKIAEFLGGGVFRPSHVLSSFVLFYGENKVKYPSKGVRVA